ncbi:small CPxCG-related zinc finger protein [Natronomonas pharaonis DSM 2160]|uniref:Small CPxCG-related zinc finger protein n=1 Tax=Natronomonas pharaonis (strain ATCC 35678 / DSM 2160 / CIP 103997 / JCM 8858 / NBRC 14720 / NCIMB 2260 / Gabara) TaxID=348780 RepID=A0A1U7EZN3_NATPD|nr:hypothetical protein [Natronomonas pharaonis]CCI69579.1 small CPxCG-related zinc finger protein [Natronomonas pharaonis DSM 2160]
MSNGECLSCGSHVSQSFVRVFGDGGNLYACPSCTTREAIKRGAAADPDHDRRVTVPPSDARRQAGDTPRATWDGRRTTSPEGVQ